MRSIVFDFDGVLVDSEPLHEFALRAAVQKVGMDFTPEQYRTRYLGFDDRDTFQIVAEDHSRALSVTELTLLTDAKREHINQSIADGKVRPFPGSLELLRAAAAAGPIAVCSGARGHEIEAILKRLEARGLVTVLVSADDVARSKPDPEPYLLTAARLGVDARSCVAIEDTTKGVRAAISAGCRVAAVCHSMTAAELSAAGAHTVVETISELSVARLQAL
jgi:beta-phosphoglucomutase